MTEVCYSEEPLSLERVRNHISELNTLHKEINTNPAEKKEKMTEYEEILKEAIFLKEQKEKMTKDIELQYVDGESSIRDDIWGAIVASECDLCDLDEDFCNGLTSEEKSKLDPIRKVLELI